MINIRHPRLYEFAESHHNAVVQYFERHQMKKIHNYLPLLDEWITLNLPGFSFKKVILADPAELEMIIGLLPNKPTFDFSRMEKLFEKFSDKDNNWTISARKMVEDLELSVCPYCNRNFIYNTTQKRSSEIDHFHSQKEYQLLAMSFFNLVPSCKVCNHFKNASKLKIINPYDTRFDWNELLKIKLKVTAADFYCNDKSVHIEFENLANEEDARERVENTIKVFALKDQYEHHRDYATELIHKKYMYSDDYLNALFKQYEGSIFRSREDLLRFVTTNFVDEKELKNRPLAKLTKDIVEQLDL